MDRGWWASAPGAEAVFAGRLLTGPALLVVLGGPYATDGVVVNGYGLPGAWLPLYVGTWRGEDGGTVRLREGGELAAEDLPAGPGDGFVARCTASGTWRERPAGARFDQRAGVDLIVSGCPGWESQWRRPGPRPARSSTRSVTRATAPCALWRSGPPDLLISS
ncbi:hypothetical protein ACFY04_35510 [Streptomyces sp. NPDC001549]|uniref:hypothetical protein n=1 Tax=Streptomyces sp. NPDC001549 TaxID=3364586 RepID=UPI003695E7CD